MKLRTRVASSHFIGSAAKLASGSGIAMVLPILAAPLLGRIYSPEDYGSLALFMAVAIILNSASVFQYQGAIIAEESDDLAGIAAWLCLSIGVVVSVFTICGVILYLSFLDVSALGSGWFAALPGTVLVSGCSATASYVANRERDYGFIAKSQVLVALTGVSISIALGMRGWGANGLMMAYLLGQAVRGSADLWLLCRSPLIRSVGRPPLRALVETARRHWRFPVFTLPTSISEQFTQQLPLLAMGMVGADSSLGAFSRARQLVSRPLKLIGAAVAQVFRREASADYQRTGTCRPRARRVALALLSLGVVPCGLFMVWAPEILTLILGPAWSEAGEMARVLAPMLLIRIVASPIGSIFYFTDHQALDFKLTLLSTVPLSLLILAAHGLRITPMQLVLLFSIGYSIIYLTQLLFAFKVASRP